jgi:peptidoglycan/LPS O-acetylase OafA/YrhL
VVERHPRGGHLPALDGLRGLAIIAVIVCHVNVVTGGPFAAGRITGPLSTVFAWGWVGVNLFFVLSGFLITGILYDAKGSVGFFRNFYARRALRIMPLYYGFLFCIVVMNRLHCLRAVWLSPEGLASLASYTYNFRFALTGHGLGDLHHFWSLAVEEHFYLIWPLAVWALRRRSLMRLCLVAAAASFLLRVILILSGVRPLAAFYITPCRLDGLLAGAWVALAWRDQADWMPLRRRAGQLVMGSGCLLLGIALGQRHFVPDVDLRTQNAAVDGSLVITVGIAALAVLFSGLVVLAVDAAQDSRWQRLLETAVMRAIGKYSYAIYVLHSLILLATLQLLSPLSRVPAYLVKPAVVIWTLAASFAAAWLSYHLYEKHFLRLKRHFAYREPASKAVTGPLPRLSPSDA